MWYKDAFFRAVVDMHIPDWDERLMSEFSAENYVDMLVKAKVDSAVVYAQSHTGVCFYPTKSGHAHNGMKGRDIFGEVAMLCKKKGIKVVAYYSLIYNTWAEDENPDWRIINHDGKPAGEGGRYGLCCPNAEGYRKFTVQQIEEVCAYGIDGIRFDMTFWPVVCFCDNCKKKYADETGAEIPLVVNWKKPEWVMFQRKREEWLVGFAKLATDTVRKFKPGISVEHQSSTHSLPWTLGVTADLSKQCDFLQGDFYGGALQGSFVCKMLYNLTENKPFGFETSCHVNLSDHTTMKTEELIKAKAYSAIANNGAFVFIDSIDPVGTLNPAVYETMGNIFNEAKQYVKYGGGELCQDVGVYINTKAKCYFTENDKHVKDCMGDVWSNELPALKVVKALRENHIPFGVVTERNINELRKHGILILPDMTMISEEECNAIREYVREGGCLYASKNTSLVDNDGNVKKDFMLSDVFGCHYEGETTENFTYIAPIEKGKKYFGDYNEKYPMSIYGTQMKVRIEKEAKVLAKIILPYTNPKETRKYSSIHCNPPGITTDYPSVIFNKFGKGWVIYVAGNLEAREPEHKIFIGLLEALVENPFVFESDAPGVVEITVFKQEDKKRYLVNVLNFQQDLPNITVRKFNVRLNTNGQTVKRLLKLPEEEEYKFTLTKKGIKFRVENLESFQMYGAEYE